MSIFQKKLLTVMSVGQKQVTVLQGSSTKLDFCASGSVDWADEPKARAALLTLIPMVQRRQMSELCLVLPRQMFFTKLIHLPSIDEPEIKKMASLQISQHLPYPEEQAVWDNVICGRRGLASDVLILAVQREAVMKYLRVLSANGLFPTVVTVSSCALAGLLSIVDPATHNVLFFPEEHSSEICFSTEGKFYFSRGIVYGTEDFSNENVTDFLAQVRLTFESQRKGFSQYGAPSGFLLTRFANDLPTDFLEKLSKESGIIWKELTVDVLRSKIGTFSFPNSSSVPVEAIAVLSILRQGLKNLSNFLPKDFKERNKVKIGRRRTAVLILLVLGAILSMTLAWSAPVMKKKLQVKILDEELKRIENPFLKLRKEKELWAAIERSLNQRVSPLSIVEELYRAAPTGISFSRIRVSEQNEINLEGQAAQSAAVNDLQEKMIAANLFRDVRLEHTVRRSTPLGEVVQFEITAKLVKTLQGKRD